jgi:hypothetical protein
MAYFGVSGAVGKNKISYNVIRLDAGRELEVQKLSISRMLNRTTKVEFITNTLLAFKPMLGDAFFRSI